MTANRSSTALIVLSIILVGGAMGSVVLNDHLDKKRQIEINELQRIENEKIEDKKTREEKDMALRLRICIAKSTDEFAKTNCYKSAEAKALPDVTLEDMNLLFEQQRLE